MEDDEKRFEQLDRQREMRPDTAKSLNDAILTQKGGIQRFNKHPLELHFKKATLCVDGERGHGYAVIERMKFEEVQFVFNWVLNETDQGWIIDQFDIEAVLNYVGEKVILEHLKKRNE